MKKLSQCDGQLLVVSDASPIQDAPSDSVQYWNGEELFVLHPESQDLLNDWITRREDQARWLDAYLPKKDRNAFLDLYHDDLMGRAMLIDSSGGSLNFARRLTSKNFSANAKETPTASFLGRKAYSAALDVALSTRKRLATVDSELLWHYGRHHDESTTIYEHIDARTEERRWNEGRKQQFAQFLQTNVKKSKIPEAMNAVEYSSKADDHQIKIQAKTAADWGLVTLLGEKKRPANAFKRETGIDISALPKENRVRRFIESMEHSVEMQGIRTSLFG